jgi:hydrogenase/urease accessory protein HupE
VRYMRFGHIWAVLFALLLAATVEAHPLGFSGLRVTVASDVIHVEGTLHTRDLSAWFPPGKFPNYVSDVCAHMDANPQELVELRLDDQPLSPAKIHCFSPETGLIEFDIDYSASAGGKDLTIWSKHLVLMPQGHQQLLSIEDARVSPRSTLLEDVLASDHDWVSMQIPITAQAGPTTTATTPTAPPRSRVSFFLLGLEHIAGGYDHLLFLAGLLLVCDGFRQAAGVITLFTVAHSITLALASLGIVHLSARVVEPAIAASIVYVGIENIFGKHRFAWRALVTFTFGLVHGLGFAAALRDTGVGSTSAGLLGPLLKFNLGVEAGQLCVAAMLLPILLIVKRRSNGSKRWVYISSVMVAGVGGYWLVTRLVAG